MIEAEEIKEKIGCTVTYRLRILISSRRIYLIEGRLEGKMRSIAGIDVQVAKRDY